MQLQPSDALPKIMLARYYGSTIASFLSADPVPGRSSDSARWNRYVYSLNDPLRIIDPDGRDPLLTMQIENAFDPQYQADADAIQQQTGCPLGTLNRLSRVEFEALAAIAILGTGGAAAPEIAAGGAVGVSLETVRQEATGEINPVKTAAAMLGGMVTGEGSALATGLPAGFYQVLGGAASAAAGGVAQRAADDDGTTKPFAISNIGTDLFAGGTATGVLSFFRSSIRAGGSAGAREIVENPAAAEAVVDVIGSAVQWVKTKVRKLFPKSSIQPTNLDRSTPD